MIAISPLQTLDLPVSRAVLSSFEHPVRLHLEKHGKGQGRGPLISLSLNCLGTASRTASAVTLATAPVAYYPRALLLSGLPVYAAIAASTPLRVRIRKPYQPWFGSRRLRLLRAGRARSPASPPPHASAAEHSSSPNSTASRYASVVPTSARQLQPALANVVSGWHRSCSALLMSSLRPRPPLPRSPLPSHASGPSSFFAILGTGLAAFATLSHHSLSRQQHIQSLRDRSRHRASQFRTVALSSAPRTNTMRPASSSVFAPQPELPTRCPATPPHPPSQA